MGSNDNRPDRRTIFVLGKSPFDEFRGSNGYGAYSYNLCLCLTTMGYDVHLVSLSAQKQGIETTPVATIHYVRSRRLARLGSGLAALWAWRIARYINHYISREDIEKFIVHGVGLWGAVR